MTFEELRNELLGVKILRDNRRYLPVKALLQTFLLSQYFLNGTSAWSFKRLVQKVDALLERFCPEDPDCDTVQPFLQLSQKGIWEISAMQELNAGEEYNEDELIQMHCNGAFSEAVMRVLDENKERIPGLMQSILKAFFPEGLHGEIIKCLDFEAHFPKPVAKKELKDSEKEVFHVYQNKCAVCGKKLRKSKPSVGLNVAYVKWTQAGGPEVVSNSLLLCDHHYHLFLLGAFTINKNHVVVESAKFADDAQAKAHLEDYHGQQIYLPDNPTEVPKTDFIEWHLKNVFKRPGRYL